MDTSVEIISAIFLSKVTYQYKFVYSDSINWKLIKLPYLFFKLKLILSYIIEFFSGEKVGIHDCLLTLQSITIVIVENNNRDPKIYNRDVL